MSTPLPHQHALQPGPGDALLIVDVQNDFLPGGNLGVPGGREIIPLLKLYCDLFRVRHLPVFATRDWHPPEHCSFMAQGGPWPPHCIAGTPGAEFPPELGLPPGVIVISKATLAGKDAYSGFADTDLDARLGQACVRRVYVGGLATDYCVLDTVRDAIRLGYAAVLLVDAIRPVKQGDGHRAENEMHRLGASFANLGCIAQ